MIYRAGTGLWIVGQPGLATARPSGGWWDLNGALSGCVAAYQAKGVASQAASYANLANPGTNDLTPSATPPSWDATNGWIFTGQFLNTGVIPFNGWSLIVRYSEVGTFNDGVGFAGALGADGGTSRFYIGYRSGGTQMRFGYGGGISDFNEATYTGIAAMAPPDAFYGTTDAGNTGTISSAVAAIYLGARNNNGTANLSLCKIQAAAIYNTSIAASIAALNTAIGAL